MNIGVGEKGKGLAKSQWHSKIRGGVCWPAVPPAATAAALADDGEWDRLTLGAWVWLAASRAARRRGREQMNTNEARMQYSKTIVYVTHDMIVELSHAHAFVSELTTHSLCWLGKFCMQAHGLFCTAWFKSRLVTLTTIWSSRKVRICLWKGRGTFLRVSVHITDQPCS